MHTYNQQTMIGARIPVILKEKLSKYCLSNGIKINYFVTQAIKERLQEEFRALKITKEGDKEYRSGKLRPIKSLSDLDK